VFFCVKNILCLKTIGLFKSVVVTPVIAGVDTPVTLVYVVPLYTYGVFTPLAMYKKLPPAVAKLVYCHLALDNPVNDVATAAPCSVTSYTVPFVEIANNLDTLPPS